MKRSEAVDILIMEGPMGMDEKISDKMLSALEKAGMLPPYDAPSISCYDHCDCGNINPYSLQWDEE